MRRALFLTAVVVRDYDEAIAFYCGKLGFELRADKRLTPAKRWVVAAPPGSGSGILLARADGDRQLAAVGNQTGGRVFLFLATDNLARDYETFRSRGVTFVREPRVEDYGSVAVFEDLYGNLWDLIEHAAGPDLSA
jgi:catechol 2,3-dioxygenase-like lactoylglutathione lyase family enzyme